MCIFYIYFYFDWLCSQTILNVRESWVFASKYVNKQKMYLNLIMMKFVKSTWAFEIYTNGWEG